MLNNLAKKGLTLSIIVGTLLVPLTALAAIWMTDPVRGAGETSAPTTTAAPVTTVTTHPTTAATVDIAADLQKACGPEGKQLVSLEQAETITAVQQAALDALREVCEQEGIPLPSKPAADPIVQTVLVPATTTAGTVPDSTTRTSHDEDDDHDEYEDEEDEEHEDD